MDLTTEYLKEAIRLSREGMLKGEGVPFGAVIVRDGAVIGQGWNRTKIHCDPTAHAEVEAIRDACRRAGSIDLSGSVIYCSTEPCPMCLAAIYWSRIDLVYYANTREQAADAGFSDLELYGELAKPREERRLRAVHLPDAEATAVFGEWLQKNEAEKL